MYFLYILQSIKTGTYYVGATNEIERRLIEHNSESGIRYTKNGKPWKLMYTEMYPSLSEARSREKQVKSWKKRSKIEALINNRYK
jgi:putative endonuclease